MSSAMPIAFITSLTLLKQLLYEILNHFGIELSELSFKTQEAYCAPLTISLNTRLYSGMLSSETVFGIVLPKFFLSTNA